MSHDLMVPIRVIHDVLMIINCMCCIIMAMIFTHNYYYYLLCSVLLSSMNLITGIILLPIATL